MQELLIILALVLLNGVLAGAEIAVVSLRRTRIDELVESGSRAAKVIKMLRAKPERFLATVQIGITVVGATAGAFGGASFAQRLAPHIAKVPALAPHAEVLALGGVVTIVSYLSLVLGELVPKSLALRSSETYSMWVSRPLFGLSVLARPVVWFLTQSSNLVLRLFGDRTNFMEARLSPEELSQLVSEASGAGGTLHPAAGKIAARALELPELTAADVMVPRKEVAVLPLRASMDEVRRILTENMHTRLPVYDGNIDNIVGYVTVKDMLFLAWEQKLFVLQDLVRKPFFAPETQRAVDLLEDMRKRRVPFAIVVDELGTLAGIVTMEDLVEELVGEIVSEHDRPPPEPAVLQEDGSLEVNASLPVREVNRDFGFELPEEGEWATVAGLVLAHAGRIPAPGDRFELSQGLELEVLEASQRRVRRVRVRRLAKPRDDEGEASKEE